MKLFPVYGGVHPDYRKERTTERPIVKMPTPSRLFLPLRQHVGAAANPVVKPGQKVKKGDVVATPHGAVSAPVHASTSGEVTAITDWVAHHPSGLPQKTIVLESDGLDEWGALPPEIEDPFSASAAEIGERIAAAGVVGLGGAAFPAAVKLNLRAGHAIDMLLLNGAECEPYLTCDDRIMQEFAAEVADGARIMARALNVAQIVVAIEANKPRAIAAMSEAAAPFDFITVVEVPVRYPMGSAHHLVKAITGRETPAHGRTASVGVLVHNVGTARAASQAVRYGRPLISRVITVSGGAMAEAHNIEVPLGATVDDVLRFCGGFKQGVTPSRLISGGPMMGHPIPSLDAPIIKGVCGVLALTADETNEQPAGPCIRCGACVTACPSGLAPLDMAAQIRREDMEKADKLGVRDCISCGSCSYICPAHIPLMHYFEYAKGRLWTLDREKRKQKRLKELVEARRERMERLAQAKAAQAAAAKAARDAAQAAAQMKADA